MNGRWLPWIALVAGLTAIGIAVAPAPAAPAFGVVPAPAAAVPVLAAVVPVPTRATAVARLPRDPPLRLRLPTLDVDAPITPAGVDPGGALEVPDDPDIVGWWREGALPGSPTGTVVLDGHVDTYADGPGALFRVGDLRPGQPVLLGTAGGEYEYVVRAIRHYPKAQLPAEVFGQSSGPRLVLISCGGPFDRRLRRYAENVVIYAVPAPGP